MALLSKKTAKRIGDAINDIAVANLMLAPTAIGMNKPDWREYKARWSNVKENAKNSLRELGIEVV